MEEKQTYQEVQRHNDSITKSENRSIMGKDNAIHIDMPYKKEMVTIYLSFSNEANDKNTQAFYDDLKQIWIEKLNLGLASLGVQR